MDLADVMDEIATQLDTITGLRVYAWPADSVQPPAAIVTYPETYTYDETFGRGMDRITLPVVLMVGKAWDRSTRDAIAPYLDGAGASSVKAVVEDGSYTSFDSVRVMSAEIDFMVMAGVDYLAATFALDIAGTGA